MMQMLGRLMWIGVGAVAVKALEAGLKSGYLETGNGHAASGRGNGDGGSTASTASSAGTQRRGTRRRTGSRSTSH